MQVVVAGAPHLAGVLTPIAEGLSRLGLPVGLDLSADIAWATHADAEVLVSLRSRCGSEEFDRLPRLHTIVVPTAGYDWIDVDAASARGIAVFNGSNDATTQGMAEAAILLLLATSYRLHAAEAAARAGTKAPPAAMLRGKQVGIVGFGRVAQEVVSLLAPFGVKILAHTRRPKYTAGVEHTSLEELVRRSDFVLVLASLNESSHHLLNREVLGLVKPGAVVVNLSRGALIDEAALTDMAREGRFRVALDVFEREPLPLASGLLDIPGAILTPHCIGHTREAADAMTDDAVDKVHGLTLGRRPTSMVNPEVGPDWSARLGLASAIS